MSLISLANIPWWVWVILVMVLILFIYPIYKYFTTPRAKRKPPEEPRRKLINEGYKE